MATQKNEVSVTGSRIGRQSYLELMRMESKEHNLAKSMISDGQDSEYYQKIGDNSSYAFYHERYIIKKRELAILREVIRKFKIACDKA